MGAMCVSKQERLQNQQRKRQNQQRKREQQQKLNNGVYAQKVRMYTNHFGRPVTITTTQFIQKQYDYNYSSQSRSEGYPQRGQLTLTYKSSLKDRFDTAYKNGSTIRNLQFLSMDEYNKWIDCKFQIFSTGKTRYYKVRFYFNDQDKFRSAIFDEQEAPYNHAEYMRNYVPPPVQPAQNYQQSSSNDYYGPPKDWGAHYAAETARSNQQFRQNMNKQAQQWNNYVNQKNNRGW